VLFCLSWEYSIDILARKAAKMVLPSTGLLPFPYLGGYSLRVDGEF